MTQMTSVHIKPCNIGQSEAHNQRTKAYLDHINAEKLYIRKDLIPENQSWTSELQGDMTLRQYYDAIGRMVKEKTGRAMQTKEWERINKKTGKVTKIAGCTPLREGVVVCKADTTMEQLQHFADLCRQR
ncbi:MAG: recombinase, partial [Segatella oris]